MWLSTIIMFVVVFLFFHSQIAAKINPAGAQNNADNNLKRSLEDGIGKEIQWGK